jgi:adenylate kinase
MRMVLLGPPGAGKGTQGEALARRYGVPHISSGELFRHEVVAGTPAGQQVSRYLAEGVLVPDDLVFAVVGGAVQRAVESGGGYVLDGFPRNLAQAERAYDLATRTGVTADCVVLLDLPDEVARQRLLGRAGDGRADDQDPAVVDRRLQVFHDETEPLIEFYRDRGMLAVVDATGPPDQVTAAAVDAVARVRGS